MFTTFWSKLIPKNLMYTVLLSFAFVYEKFAVLAVAL